MAILHHLIPCIHKYLPLLEAATDLAECFSLFIKHTLSSVNGTILKHSDIAIKIIFPYLSEWVMNTLSKQPLNGILDTCWFDPDEDLYG